jgi:hypothetical protein
MEKYCKRAIFHLPGIFEHTQFYNCLTALYRDRREMFYDNMEIGSIYGAPGSCIWNGGRMVFALTSKKQLQLIKDGMAAIGIPVRFTFTNCLLEDKHVYDTYCNMVTTMFSDGNNEILCNSPILEQYLRENFPQYSFISSTTKRLLDIDAFNKELEKDYKLVVLDYALNRNKKFLKKIRNKKKVETLCNAVCIPNCPNRMDHYINLSKCQLEASPEEVLECEHSNCPFYIAKQREHFIDREDINNYLRQGFCNFKLEGRTAHPLDLVEIILYYLRTPEYQTEARAALCGADW